MSNPLVSEALRDFLHARKTPANQDLVDRCSINMEVQVNVMAADGEPVAGKKSTWTNGSDTWHSIRIPKNVATDPTWEDYRIGYPFDLYAEGIGMTGWDWKARVSRHFGYDFDALTGHAQGIGVTDEQLEKVKQAACALPYVEVRRSTGGGGIHLYVYLDEAGVPTANHTEHAALARCILGMMSAEVGFDFASAIDAYGHVMWIWHRKMSAENHGLEIIKPATKRLSEADIPTNWRDHIEAVKSKPKLEPKATPKPRHAVDDDFIRTSDFGFLLEKGWRRNGEHFARPGTEKAVSASIVAAEDGTRLLHVFSSNGDPFEKDRNYNPFDAFKLLFHDGNAEAARADLLKQGYGRLRIPLLTCRQLDGNDYKQTYLIPGVYVPKQPCLVGGPRKGMKTSILIALAIALAACLRFLGHFVVTRPVKVIILSGESGMATLQETARRIAKSMGLSLSEIENLFWSDFLPRLDDAQHLDALERMIEETGCEVLIVDPAYLCLPGGDAGNIFIQGSLLRSINEICQRHGVGLVLAHHFRKRAKAKSTTDFDPPELDDLSWSGFAEFARQWILLGRRESYEPGSGEHRLWMSVGGSAGHSALWGVDINEGVSGEPRHWNVELLTPDEARVEKKGGIIRQRLLDAMREFPEGTTKTLLFDTAKPKLRNEPSTRNVLDALITEGLLVACDIKKNGQTYPGVRLPTEADKA